MLGKTERKKKYKQWHYRYHTVTRKAVQTCQLMSPWRLSSLCKSAMAVFFNSWTASWGFLAYPIGNIFNLILVDREHVNLIQIDSEHVNLIQTDRGYVNLILVDMENTNLIQVDRGHTNLILVEMEHVNLIQVGREHVNFTRLTDCNITTDCYQEHGLKTRKILIRYDSLAQTTCAIS